MAECSPNFTGQTSRPTTAQLVLPTAQPRSTVTSGSGMRSSLGSEAPLRRNCLRRVSRFLHPELRTMLRQQRFHVWVTEQVRDFLTALCPGGQCMAMKFVRLCRSLLSIRLLIPGNCRRLREEWWSRSPSTSVGKSSAKLFSKVWAPSSTRKFWLHWRIGISIPPRRMEWPSPPNRTPSFTFGHAVSLTASSLLSPRTAAIINV